MDASERSVYLLAETHILGLVVIVFKDRWEEI
jgi:hypothetical protein